MKYDGIGWNMMEYGYPQLLNYGLTTKGVAYCLIV